MNDVFISYAQEDEAFVKELDTLLSHEGFSVFWDRRIAVGQTWRNVIASALAEARCVVVVWSSHSIASEFVAEEADDAKARGILHPVFIDHVQAPLGFRSIQAADLTASPISIHSAEIRRLLDDIRSTLSRSPRSPGAPDEGEDRSERIDSNEPSIRTDGVYAEAATSTPSTPRFVIILIVILSAVVCLAFTISMITLFAASAYAACTGLVAIVASTRRFKWLNERRRLVVTTVAITGLGTMAIWRGLWFLIVKLAS